MEKYSERMVDAIEDCINAWSQIQEEIIKKGLARLAAYEDTGLTPETCAEYKKFENEAVGKGVTFARIIELMDAEKDGRLFIPSVKVGDMFWPICWDGVLGAWVVDDQPERVNEVGTTGFFVSATYGEPEEIDEFHPYEEIGDVYFRSHKEAVDAAKTKERPEEVQDDG